MTQSDGQIIIQVSLDDKEAKNGLDGIDKETDKLEKGASSKFSKISGGIKAVGLAAVGVVGAVAGLGVAVGGLAAPLVKAAAGAQAMNAQFGQVFGELQKQAQTTIDTLGENFGMMPERIKPAFTQMTSMFKGLGLDTNTAMGEAEKAVTAVADAAAFYDLSFNDANAALNSFIKGNYEGGEAIGLFANETQMASYAMKEGLIGATKEWASLDEATKQATRLEYALAMQNMAGATGQATRESDSLENQLGNLNQAWENLKALLGAPLLEPAIQGIKLLTGIIQNFDATPFTAAFETIKTNVSTAIDTIKIYVQNGLTTVRTYFEENGTSIRDTVQNAFNNAKTIIESVLNAVVPFVQNQLAKVKQFWSDNGVQIMQAAKIAFEGIKAIIEFVMPAIQFVIEYVWNAIKNIINGVLDVIMGLVKTFSSLLTGDFKGMWEGIKQIFSGAIDLIMGWMSLSFVGGIRTLVTNLAKTFINIIKTKWTTVVGLFKSSVNTVSSTISSWVSKLLSFVKNLATNFTSTVTTLRTTVVNRFKELSTQVINAVKGLPSKMLQMGKDVINGFVKGITEKTGEAIAAIGNVMDGVIEKAAGILGWASPAKEFIAMGSDTIKGYVIGLKKEYKLAEGAMQDVFGNLIDVAEHYSSEQVKLQKQLGVDMAKVNAESAEKIAKIQESANSKIASIQAKARKKKRSLTIAEKSEIAKIEKNSVDEISKIKKNAIEKNAKLESAATKNSIKALEDSNKEYLATVQAFIDDKKSLGQLNIIDEVKVWERSIQLFDEGTTERIKAQQKYKAAVETVNKEITTINEQYQAQMLKVDEDYIREAERINKEYEDTFNNRVSSLLSFASTFEEFKVELTRTGEELTTNLQSQVDGFKLWQEEFEKLSSRGVDGELLDELSNLGVKALPELVALNSMTDEQLTRYSELYREKSQLAREQAGKELEGMRKDTDKKLLDLRAVSDAQLSKLQTEWDLKIKNLVRATDTELSTLHQVGIDAGQGLLDGLASMESPLIDKAQAIADAIKATIQSALDIHSPSRWMRDFIAGNLAKGFDIGVDKNSSIFTDASARIGDLMKVNIVNPLRGVSMNLGSVGTKSLSQIQNSSYTNQINNSRTMNNQITVGSKEDAAAYERLMRRMKFEFGL